VCWHKTIDTNSFTGEDLCYRRFLNHEHNLSQPPTECPDNSYCKCAIIVSLWTWQTICVMVYSHRGCRYNINITEDTTLHQHHPVGCSPPHRHTVHGECAVNANDNDWGFGTTWLEDTSSPYIRLPHLFASPCVAQLWAAFPKAKAPCSEGILPRVWEGGYLFLIGHDSIDWTQNALDRSWTSSSLRQPSPWTSCGFDPNLGWYCLLRIGRRHMCRLKPPQDTVSCSFEWLWSLGENALKGWWHLLWIEETAYVWVETTLVRPLLHFRTWKVQNENPNLFWRLGFLHRFTAVKLLFLFKLVTFTSSLPNFLTS